MSKKDLKLSIATFIVALIMVAALSSAVTFALVQRPPKEDNPLVEINARLDKISKEAYCPDVSFAGVYARLDEMDATLRQVNASVVKRAPKQICYPDFEFSEIEIIHLPDCQLEEEPTADHVIIYICAEEGYYLSKLVVAILDELKRIEGEFQEEGVVFWVHFPQ